MVDIAQFIPAPLRGTRDRSTTVRNSGQLEGHRPQYVLTKGQIDLFPVDTFMITAETGTGGYPDQVMRLVVPRRPGAYPLKNRTSGGRLLYICWMNGHAVKRLADMRPALVLNYIVQPGEPGHEEIAAFKFACDVRRLQSDVPVPTKPDLLLRALDWRGPGHSENTG